MNFQNIESAAFRSWPAMEQIQEGGVVLRFSDGYTKRANSANILTRQEGDYYALVSRCEQYFKKKEVPCIFRLPSFCDNRQFDQYLGSNNYQLLDRSLVLSRSLQGATFDNQGLVLKKSREWLTDFCRISDTDINQHEAHLAILDRINDQALMAVLVENGAEVACGVGVISNGYFGLYDLVTEHDSRKKGYATKLLNGMLCWAVAQGASTAYLQVVARNKSAISLYNKMGYEHCYEYWYMARNPPTSI
ncbi:MAG: GNAT superfamily N-acetyltransferase [Oceanicoccus sp.]